MNKKAQKTLKELALELERSDGIVMILVYTAGVGRQGFKASLGGVDDEIDRQDGDDEEVYDTPGDALRGFADQLDRSLILEAWLARLDELREKP